MAKKQQDSLRRPRRSLDQQIADLQTKIEAIKTREAEKRAKADPVLRHARAAIRSIDKALEVVDDPASKKALGEARSSLALCLAGGGGVLLPAKGRRSASERAGLASELLTYVRDHPGQRGEQIASALGTDTATMRPAMKQLIADGKVSTEGQKRGMTYAPV